MEVKRLQKGDYEIVVHVIECRNLKSDGTIDPVCQVQVMEQRKTTIIHRELSFDKIHDIVCFFDSNVFAICNVK